MTKEEQIEQAKKVVQAHNYRVIDPAEKSEERKPAARPAQRRPASRPSFKQTQQQAPAEDAFDNDFMTIANRFMPED